MNERIECIELMAVAPNGPGGCNGPPIELGVAKRTYLYESETVTIWYAEEADGRFRDRVERTERSSRQSEPSPPPVVLRPRTQAASAIDQVMASDRRFFAKRPHRGHRLRRAHKIEIDEAARIGNIGALPDGARWFMAVHRIGEGMRARELFWALAELDTDMSDSEIELLLAARPKI